ncbi:UNVERIFIED_CONTAM: hypothetical protein GTU68_013295 [Idotea baltica]|nr:hypothetical protein [Idotea baltica]
MLFRPLRMLADKFNTLQMGLIASERVFNLLDDKLFIEDKGTKRLTETKGNIAFENVSFAYNEKDLVLKNVSFNIKSGETLAIVGATGAGKSSVINVLNRFYEIQKGKITIDGVDIKDVQLDSLRSNIGLVLQDVFLFSGSVMENITLSDMTIQKEKVIEAARLVGASEFIDRLPGKYDFDVRERGVSLSLGQRQLISFIRTLVFDPKILILDEATSSVDTETEQLIQNATATLIKDRTSIVIAHRLSTIRHADNIMVLDKGQIVEFGNHSQLMDQQGYYHQLIEMQQAQEKAKIEQF